MVERLRTGFFGYGWLMPVVLPMTQVGGRALFNVLLGLYLLWGIVAAAGRRLPQPRAALIAYAALLAGYLLSVPGALDVGQSVGDWAKFALYSLTFYFTLLVLDREPAALERLLSVMGIAGLAFLVLLFAVLPWQMAKPDFATTQHLKEDSLPFVVPFVLYWLGRALRAPWQIPGQLFVLAAALGYILYSQGRAALAGLLCVVFIYGVWVLRARLWLVGLACVVLLGIGAVLGTNFFRSAELPLTEREAAPQSAAPPAAEGDAWIEQADRFSSARVQLWRQALQYPPRSLWTGVGIGNVGAVTEVVTVAGGQRLGHLHNFLLDAWYETGFLGLAGLLGFIAYAYAVGIPRARVADSSGCQAGVLLAAATAILAAGMFSFSYTSRQFVVYLPFALAALIHLAQRPRCG